MAKASRAKRVKSGGEGKTTVPADGVLVGSTLQDWREFNGLCFSELVAHGQFGPHRYEVCRSVPGLGIIVSYRDKQFATTINVKAILDLLEASFPKKGKAQRGK